MSNVVPRVSFFDSDGRYDALAQPSGGLTEPRDALAELADPELQSRFGGAVIDESGREIPITEAMIAQALLAFDAGIAPASPSASSIRR